MIDMRSPHFTQNYPKTIFGNSNFVPPAVIDSYVSSMPDPPQPVSSDPEMKRLPIFLSVVQHGRYLEFLGEEPKLFPLERIHNEKFKPFLFLYHGSDDSLVPAEGSKKFLEELANFQPEVKVTSAFIPGEHGVGKDSDFETEAWLGDGLKDVKKVWLA